MSLATRATRARHDPGTALWAVAGATWLLLIVLALVGTPQLAHHHGVADALRSGTQPTLVVLAVFAGFWLVMVSAMMLPTTVPMVRMFHTVSAGQARPGTARASFLAAYFAIWLAFAAVALLGDLAVHATVERWTWLAAHDGLVLAGALALAGGMQFSALKQRCLTIGLSVQVIDWVSTTWGALSPTFISPAAMSACTTSTSPTVRRKTWTLRGVWRTW